MNDLELQGMRNTHEIPREPSEKFDPTACMHMAHLALPHSMIILVNT